MIPSRKSPKWLVLLLVGVVVIVLLVGAGFALFAPGPSVNAKYHERFDGSKKLSVASIVFDGERPFAIHLEASYSLGATKRTLLEEDFTFERDGDFSLTRSGSELSFALKSQTGEPRVLFTTELSDVDSLKEKTVDQIRSIAPFELREGRPGQASWTFVRTLDVPEGKPAEEFVRIKMRITPPAK